MFSFMRVMEGSVFLERHHSFYYMLWKLLCMVCGLFLKSRLPLIAQLISFLTLSFYKEPKVKKVARKCPPAQMSMQFITQIAPQTFTAIRTRVRGKIFLYNKFSFQKITKYLYKNIEWYFKSIVLTLIFMSMFYECNLFMSKSINECPSSWS